MALVIDASIALAWLLNEPNRRMADEAIEAGLAAGLATPELFWIEVADVLGQRIRRGALAAAQRDEALADLRSVGIVQHQSAEKLTQIVALSDRHGLTAYDAAYLELAMRLGAALTTLDRDLVAAARAEGLEVMTA